MAPSPLWLNRGGQNIVTRLRSWLNVGGMHTPAIITLVAGYVSIRGLMKIEGQLRAAVDRGVEVRLLLAVTRDEVAWISHPEPFVDVPDMLRRRLTGDVESLRAEIAGIPAGKDSALRLLGLAHLLRRDRFDCRRHETKFVHSKVFSQHGGGFAPIAVLGSANLTIGGFERNEECCAAITGIDADEAVNYSTDLWNEASPFDLAALIDEQFANYPQELVFLRMLFELFGNDVDAADQLSLTPWQRDGVARALAIAEVYGGALIADDVGLGKTFEAAEIIRRAVHEDRGRALVVCPANLVTMWNTRLAGWNLSADVLSYHALPQAVEDANISAVAFPYHLVVLDEAHWLRNPTTWRHALRVALASATTPPKVFALTATPIQNCGKDIVEILTIALHRLTVEQRRHLLGRCRRPDQLDGADLTALHDLLETMTVRRTRGFVRTNYDTTTLDFPQQHTGEIRYALPSTVRHLVRDVLAALGAGQSTLSASALADFQALTNDSSPPDALTMAAHHLQDYYLADDLTPSPDSTHLIKCMLCKRLESSVAALASTLDAMRSRCLTVLKELDLGFVTLRHVPPADTSDASDEQLQQDWETDEPIVRSPLDHTLRYSADSFAVEELRTNLLSDIATLRNLCDRAEALISADPKPPAVLEQLVKIARDPCRPKVVIFTGSRVTGAYLTAWLIDHVDRDPRLAVYRGRLESLARLHRVSDKQAQQIIADFAPQAAGSTPGLLGGKYPQNRHDLLICTDMLAEGINLQQSAFLIHYDLPWNPMMLQQRAGRVNRLGSPYDEVICFSVFPDQGIDAQLHLLERLYSKIDIAAAAVGVPTPIIPGATVAARDFTSAALNPGPPDPFPAFSSDIYRVALANALRSPAVGAAIRDLPRKSGGVAGNGELRGYVFCFRLTERTAEKAALCTIFLDGVSLLGQNSCLREAACDVAGWLKRGKRDAKYLVQPRGQLAEQVLQHLWPSLEEARDQVAAANGIPEANRETHITLITWLALTA